MSQKIIEEEEKSSKDTKSDRPINLVVSKGSGILRKQKTFLRSSQTSYYESSETMTGDELVHPNSEVVSVSKFKTI